MSRPSVEKNLLAALTKNISELQQYFEILCRKLHDPEHDGTFQADLEQFLAPWTREEKLKTAILETIRYIKETDRGQGAVGVFITGPFTLAGQVMEMDELYMMLLK